MRLYHATTPGVADLIMGSGFRDARGTYMTEHEHEGVWLSAEPLTINEGADGEEILAMEMPDDVVVPYEWVEEGKPYREFLVPAELVNGYPIVSRETYWDWHEREA